MKKINKDSSRVLFDVLKDGNSPEHNGYSQFFERFRDINNVFDFFAGRLTSIVQRYAGRQSKSEYPYFCNSSIILFMYILKCLKIRRVFDCGSGDGTFISFVRNYSEKIMGYRVDRIFGFENNLKTCELSYSVCANRDLFSIDEKDIDVYECIYFWEPIHDSHIAELFFDKLRFNMNNDQIVVCRSSHFSRYLQSKNFTDAFYYEGYTIARNLSTNPKYTKCPDTPKTQKKVKSPTHGDLITQ